MTGSSRETLAMEMNQSAASVSFGKRNGCYVNRSVAVILGLLFVSATVATGLLVYYYAPQVREAGDPLNLARTSLATERPMVPTTPMTPAAEVKPKIDVRLPRSVKPLHYKVKLQPLINGNFSILGYVEVEVEVLEATSNVTLHIADIVTKNETIRLAPSDQVQGPGIGINKHSYDNERQFYVAELGHSILSTTRQLVSQYLDILVLSTCTIHQWACHLTILDNPWVIQTLQGSQWAFLIILDSH